MSDPNSHKLQTIFSEFIVDTMNGIMVFDENDQIISCNKIIAEIYGLTDIRLLLGNNLQPNGYPLLSYQYRVRHRN